MDLNRIKKFAQGSRRKLLLQIETRLDYVVGHDDAYLRAHGKEKKTIQQLHERKGREYLLEEVAYTWFNRLAALRYMDAKGFFPVRVVTPALGETQPEILAEMKVGRFPEQVQTARSEINAYLDGRVRTSEPEREAYKSALLAWCNAMGDILPFLFTTVEDWIALLLPSDLLSRDSIISDFQVGMTDDDCRDVEIIGWLYQFYISEKKDEVIGKVVKSEDIPAATQLFTPDWIVKYMVQNSLGAQWLATYPDSPLKAKMEFYIEPAEQTQEVKAQLAKMTPDTLDPEKMTLLDPACGSGHILTEAYDVFKAIYLECGYPEQEVPRLIVEKNLFGLDIDERAAQLSCFALTMKAREDDRRLFERLMMLNVMALHDSSAFDARALANEVPLSDYGLNPADLTELKALFEYATTVGSLIQVPDELRPKLPELKRLSEATSPQLFVSEALGRLRPMVKQAELLAAKYDAVVANPPYMGRKYQPQQLKKIAREHFPDARSDVFACFLERGYSYAKVAGYNAMITMQSWMFLSSFQTMRERLLTDTIVRTMAHLGARAFGSISGEVVQTTACVLQNSSIRSYKPVFFRLLEGGEEEKRTALAHGSRRFDRIPQDGFVKIPGSPVAYWASRPVVDSFRNRKIGELSTLFQGIITGNNELFVRSWTEIPIDRATLNAKCVGDVDCRHKYWVPYNKGGSFRKWYGNRDLVVNFKERGRDFTRGRYQFYELFFKPCFSWTYVGSSSMAVRYFDNSIWDVHGSSAFPHSDDDLEYFMGLLTSPVGFEILSVLNPTISFQVENIAAVPVVFVSEESKGTIVDRVASLIDTAQKDWDLSETSWDFQFLPLLTSFSEPMTSLESSYNEWITHNRYTIAEMKRLEEENNRLFIDAYGLADELTPEVPIEQITLRVNPAYRYGAKLTEEEQWSRFRHDTMEELVSYAVGCIMGRYSLDKPGLILANAGDEIQEYLKQVPEPRFMPDEDGILPVTAEDDFEDDLPSRVKEFTRVALPAEHYDENIRFLQDGLGKDIKTYILRDFYKTHVKTYKTRPIYWMVSSPSGAFRCLIYLHRYTQDTVGTIMGSYLRPYRNKLEVRRQQNRHVIDSPSRKTAEKTKAQKALDEGTRALQELEQWEREVVYPLAQERVALDLDDGVKVNYRKLGAILEKVKGLNA